MEKKMNCGFSKNDGKSGSTAFPRLRKDIVESLEQYVDILDEVLPLKKWQADELPFAIEKLSRSLTSERGEGVVANYFSKPENRAAYLYYFLPWNLFRFSRLLLGLNLKLKEGDTILDLGAGPLTFAQALWLVRPDLRSKKLRFICVDQTLNALKFGKQLLISLSNQTNSHLKKNDNFPWEIQLIQGPLHKNLRQNVDFIFFGQVINELLKDRSEETEEFSGELAYRLMNSVLKPEGQILFVEPGTRMSAKNLTEFRDKLIEFGALVLSPCTHSSECPMNHPKAKFWCHFNFDLQGVPRWLRELTEDVGFLRKNVSLSYLLITSNKVTSVDEDTEEKSSQNLIKLARVISESFPLPQKGSRSFGAYACCDTGLLLLISNQRKFFHGNLQKIRWPQKVKRDFKSGAIEISDEYFVS